MSRGIAARAVAEGVGTAFLLVAVVGSGIMAEALAQGNTALALLANAVATGCALLVLILTFAPISGAHFNPLVTLAATFKGHLRARDVPSYLVAQMAGAVVGVWLAHLMFDLPILQLSVHRRHGLGQWAGEIVATAGLFMVIESGERHFPKALSGAIAAYITAAYWFTSSTSFANPAVTVARSLSNSFAGIDPADILGFVLAQAVGAALAVTLFRWFDAAPRD